MLVLFPEVAIWTKQLKVVFLVPAAEGKRDDVVNVKLGANAIAAYRALVHLLKPEGKDNIGVPAPAVCSPRGIACPYVQADFLSIFFDPRPLGRQRFRVVLAITEPPSLPNPLRVTRLVASGVLSQFCFLFWCGRPVFGGFARPAFCSEAVFTRVIFCEGAKFKELATFAALPHLEPAPGIAGTAADATATAIEEALEQREVADVVQA